jgi:hypothetical protein
MDAVIGGASHFPYHIVAATVHSLLPVIEQLRRTSTAELEIDTLEERMRDEALVGKGVALSPALIGAWSRNQA